MYKIGTKVPFSGVITRVEVKRSYGLFNKIKKIVFYTIKDEYGVETVLEEKYVKKLMED